MKKLFNIKSIWLNLTFFIVLIVCLLLIYQEQIFNLSKNYIICLLLIYTLLFIINILLTNNMPLILIFNIFLSGPILILWGYILTGYKVSVYMEFWNNSTIKDSLIIMIYTQYCFFINNIKYKPLSKNYEVKCFKFNNHFSRFMLPISCLLVIIFTIFANQGQTLFQAGVYNSTNNKGFLGLDIWGEFATIFVILGSLSIKPKSKLRWFLLSSIFASILIDLLYGKRIEPLQLILCSIVIFFRDNLSKRKILILAVIGFSFFTIIGNLRQNLNGGLHFFSLISPFQVNYNLNSLQPSLFGDINYNFLAAVGLIKEHLFHNFFYGFYYIVLIPTSFMTSDLAVSLFGKIAQTPENIIFSFTQAGGGSYIVGTLLFNFNIWGTMIILYLLIPLLYKLEKKVNYSNQDIYKLIYIVLFTTMPRLIFYMEISFVKQLVWLLITYAIFVIISKQKSKYVIFKKTYR